MKISQVYNYINKYGQLDVEGYHWLSIARIICEKKEYVGIWCDDYKQKYYPPPDIQTETTFDRCVRATFVINNNDVIMKIIIYNGDSYNGRRTDKRCIFEVPIKSVFTNLKLLIVDYIKVIATDVCVEEDQRAFNIRVNAHMEKILNEL